MSSKGKMTKLRRKRTLETARNIVPILGIGIDSGLRGEVLNRAWSLISTECEARPSLIVTPNPEIVSRAQSDHELAYILNGADLAVPDGIGIVAAAWVLHPNSKMFRIPGRLFAEELVKLCSKHNKKVFLLGGAPGAAELAVKNIKNRTKNKELRIVGVEGPRLSIDGKPVDEVQEQIEKEVVKRINSFKPDLLLVGFGAPKQEKWLARHLGKINASAAMVVGGMIDYTAGILPLPPRAFSELGFEWLWRLITQPARLGRILTAVVVFPCQVLFWKFNNR
ncbi:MAG: hypothetical protein A3A58_02290 [Candidatus Blackburnbacteria bacterium RIFCSPLOWO2_01_FULL_41_27]|uniref:Uncharacterized protein n=1 Tax=Candidatus Blackburnbacteria bacterium RIFCSPLOWO2_01_FULL_41_27 TaxID=1797520 RepID=A0A1G1VBD1_9BACT|nr:MAG: hypothetical protein A3A58_02290 [Candidatus Blackburnbacteria bacterium RIFCSPLOWO2_01_FULL_41_27]